MKHIQESNKVFSIKPTTYIEWYPRPFIYSPEGDTIEISMVIRLVLS